MCAGCSVSPNRLIMEPSCLYSICKCYCFMRNIRKYPVCCFQPRSKEPSIMQYPLITYPDYWNQDTTCLQSSRTSWLPGISVYTYYTLTLVSWKQLCPLLSSLERAAFHLSPTGPFASLKTSSSQPVSEDPFAGRISDILHIRYEHNHL